MLQAEQIEVRFEGLIAIDKVSLSLEQGSILGLIGPNGAGKSTLVNALTGFQKRTQVVVRMVEVDMGDWTAV